MLQPGLGFASFNPHDHPENTCSILILQTLLSQQSFPGNNKGALEAHLTLILTRRLP